MKKHKLKYIGVYEVGVMGESFMGKVKQNDIIEVNETDMNRLLLKQFNGKPAFEAVKPAKKEKATEE